MNSLLQDPFADRLHALKQRFVERLKVELVSLEAYGQQLEQQGVELESMRNCVQRLHQLAGSAGTFGFPEVGELARELEKRLKTEVEHWPDGAGAGHLGAEACTSLAVQFRALVARMKTESAEPVPDRDQAATTVIDEASLHGQQVRLLVVSDGLSELDGLVEALSRYGFNVLVLGLSDDRFSETNRATLLDNVATVICWHGLVERVAKQVSGHHADAWPELMPLVCIGETDQFEQRYRVASAGARAFFSEPVDVPELVERVETFVEEKTSRVRGRVMIIDDDRELAEHYSLVLAAAGIEPRVVNAPAQLFEALHGFEPDLVLMDIELGHYSGVTLAGMIRFHARWLSLPIIYLSAEDDLESQLQALSGGADEFLVKPISDDYLIRSVQMRCQRARQLSELMNRDSLTRLLKHSIIKQDVERERLRSMRGDYPSCVVLLDIDHFKQVNDTWGHAQGDVVIRALANLLRNRLRESDAIGRYGGEEFLVVLSNCDAPAAEHLVGRILQNFSELEFAVGEQAFQVTFSAGIALINQFAEGDQAIEAADRALYARKRAGRNGVMIYDQSMAGQSLSPADGL